MQKAILALMLVGVALTTSACQPKTETSEQSVKPLDTSTPIKAEVPEVVQDATVKAQTCLALNQAMQKVGDNSKIEAIYAIQEQLRACLPTVNNTEVIALLESYQAMYSRFLIHDTNVNDESLNALLYDLSYGDGLSEEQLEAMSPRIQYLVELLTSDADVRIRDLGEGFFSLDHNLKTMADIFTPYLREDQRLFIRRMAIDNQEVLWSDASVTASFEELIERAVFWEDYIQRFPNGYSVKDAKGLLDLYRYQLIFGSDNTQWTDDAMHEFVSPEYKTAIEKLTKRSNSILAKDAKEYLEFMAMSDSQREINYPVPSVDENGDEMNDWAQVRYQFTQATSIHSSWDYDNTRDCLVSVICLDYEVQ